MRPESQGIEVFAKHGNVKVKNMVMSVLSSIHLPNNQQVYCED
jgi:hypothetical protein